MPRQFTHFTLSLLTVLLILSVALRTTYAADLLPNEHAEWIRRTLFTAQTALLNDDPMIARAQVTDALTRYTDSLAPTLKALTPGLDQAVQASFEQLISAAESRNVTQFAAERARLWTTLLQSGFQITVQATEKKDFQTAKQWLLVREYRSSSRFALPGADGTLALGDAITGKLTPEATVEAIRHDLYDTYQAQLNKSLADSDTALSKNYLIKLAETTSAARGYFDILSDAYLQRKGSESLTAAQKTFDQWVSSALIDTRRYPTTRAAITETLRGFRAAPLTQAEIERRVGQLLRYLSLVDVEYARGVRDGKVVKDLEIQEALTFREGAAAAFVDLQPILEGRNPELTAKVAGGLSDLKRQIDTVADPKVVEDTVAQMGDWLAQLIPADWQKSTTSADFDVIYSVLDQIEPAIKQEQYPLAENARIEAYAILDTGIEQKLRGFAPELSVQIESAFWTGEPGHPGLAILIANRAPLAEVKAGLLRLKDYLKQAQTVMSSFQSAPGAVVGNAAVIVFREGLEAVLILASLIASLRTAATLKYRRPIFIGGLLALVVTAITWVIANSLLTALARYGERLEAVVSLISIGVLLLITNWFFHKTYWTGWMANFHKQKSQIIGGKVSVGPFLALVILGFTSIYREGFETVLFLQSLVLEAGIVLVLEGVLIGLIGTAVVGAITFGVQARLPYRQMLIVTGIMIGVVLVAMVGKTVFVMQTVGWMPITPINGVYFPYWVGQWFGVYATWQGIGLQIGSAVFVIGSYVLAESQQKSKREQMTASRKSAAPST